MDRLPVLVSSMETTQLLAVPKLGRGTGEAQAVAVHAVLEDWGIAERVSGMGFDTTLSNTGRNIGACVLLEAKL